MKQERTERAIGRIEAAMARLEAATAQTAPATATAAALAETRERHERLRAAVGDALGQLDTLIAGARS